MTSGSNASYVLSKIIFMKFEFLSYISSKYHSNNRATEFFWNIFRKYGSNLHRYRHLRVPRDYSLEWYPIYVYFFILFTLKMFNTLIYKSIHHTILPGIQYFKTNCTISMTFPPPMSIVSQSQVYPLNRNRCTLYSLLQ